ncbi:type IX secretion system membrane protein, PorP/SprF family [Tangfeifania diversioriginum]|uniref:Type IX secretion system membrane protein, PorP/SprF family n=1 Tax=Tangfeifania diversioriginum TaxID=1168035 RepID=A0A1M6E5D2_9BACT|nr:PorP/SprF family type IX secretion system membrane protein [Tangfeifania diversioriginum]SHI80764.1 type IX secretion system membrane protein, PorP/SprF family [Tangfeifania diversioriginum]
MRCFRHSILIFLLFLSFQAKTQEFPYHYFSHTAPVISNPSLAAAQTSLDVQVGAYNLWAGGFKPVSDYLISFSWSPDAMNRRGYGRQSTRVGLGATLLNEKIGPFNQYILHLMYAYHIPLTREIQLSLGVCGIIENLNIDVNSLSPLHPDDPRLLTGNNRSFLFDGGFGASILSDNWVVGLSLLNLAPGTFRFSEEPAAEFSSFRKLFLSGSYFWGLGQNFGIQPHITLRNSNLKWLNYDASLKFDLQYFHVGAGYRSENSLFLFLNVPLEGFTFSYTSENPLNANHMMGNGHTFSVGWML